MADGDYYCENCGSTEFYQHVEQQELVSADENGFPENFKVVGEIAVNHIECANCEAVLES